MRPRRAERIAAAVLGLVLAASGTRAQESDFFETAEDYFRSEKIEGVSKHAESPTETPATVTILSREDIERYGFRTVADVLNFASMGNYVADDRRYELAGSRGLFFLEDFNTRILVMLNGHSLNEPWANFAGIGRQMLVPLDLVERIEIVYGPSSLLYGGYSLYGIVNVVTGNGATLPGGQVRLSAGTWTTGEVVASYGATGVSDDGNWETSGTQWSLLASAGYYTTEGEDLDLPRFDAGYVTGLDGGTIWGGPQSGTDFSRAPFAFVHGRYGDVSVMARAGYRKRGEPLAPYGAVYGSDRQSVRDSKAFAELRWDHEFPHGLTASARAFRDTYKYDERDPFADAESYPGESGYDFELSADDSDAGGEARLQYRHGTHFLTLGGEFRHRSIEQVQATRFFDGRLAPDSRIRDRRTGQIGVVYLQEEWRPLDWLSLIAGGNWADTSPGGSRAQPRLAAIFKPDRTLAIKALYGRGFRPPSLFEAAYRDFQFQVDNPDLRSEEIASAELSVMWNPDPRVSIQGYAFRSRLEGLIQGISVSSAADLQGRVGSRPDDPLTAAELASLGVLQYQSGGDVRSSGVGVGTRYRGRRVRGYLNVAWARATLERFREADLRLPGSSQWLASGGLSYDRADWTASLTGRYVGPQTLEPFRGPGQAGDFVEANLRVLYRTRLVYPLTLQFDVRNLFDEEGGPATSSSFAPATAPLPGRQFVLGAEVRF